MNNSEKDFYYKTPFIGYAEFFEGNPPEPNLLNILNISRKELNSFGMENIMKRKKEPEINAYFKKLSYGIQAYLQFQDLLDYSISVQDPDAMKEDLFACRHYCYFESIVYLRQTTISLFNNNSLSALVLMRPFLELSILNLYWHYISKTKGFYQLIRWLKGERGKPPFQNSLIYITENQTLLFPNITKDINIIKSNLKRLFDSFSDYNHTPKISRSLGEKSGGLNIFHFEDLLYSLHMLNILLYWIVFLYTIAHPMILFPVDEYKKFGFKAPMNVFADDCNYKIINRYLDPKHQKTLTETLSNSDIVTGNLDFYNQQRDLTENEIAQSWNESIRKKKFNKENMDKLKTEEKAKHRALQWSMSYFIYEDFKENQKINYTDEEINNIFSKFYDL